MHQSPAAPCSAPSAAAAAAVWVARAAVVAAAGAAAARAAPVGGCGRLTCRCWTASRCGFSLADGGPAEGTSRPYQHGAVINKQDLTLLLHLPLPGLPQLATKAVSAGVLNGVGDAIAQLIFEKDGKFDWKRLGIFTFLVRPVLCGG